jgi:hypothetical protein
MEHTAQAAKDFGAGRCNEPGESFDPLEKNDDL